MVQRSLDECEKAAWCPAPAPFETPFETVMLQDTALPLAETGVVCQSLNGTWQMIDGGYTEERTDLSRPWEGAVAAQVPCSIHTALLEAGKIPDPMVAKNDKRARENSYKTWWLKREFDRDERLTAPVLHFDGVCYSAMFWLNGHYLGYHRGMFGGPDFDVSALLREHNTLIVKIENAPADPRPYSAYADYDEGWTSGVVINCVYGWHYACIPSRGIWQPVTLISTPRCRAERPFVVTIDPWKGIVDLCLRLNGGACHGVLRGKIEPDNFEGAAQWFTVPFTAAEGETRLHYRMQLADARQWWPNGHGGQPLYRLTLDVCPADDLLQHFEERFGLRTIEMAPLPDGPREDRHNWTFVINGKPLFVKGTNWCTIDALLRFPKERYERFLSLAKAQHVQLLRAWGGGMPESDTFYELCDRLGLMVAQEWPTCWDSQKKQPQAELLETARLATVRLRNHPSLIQWAGGNESPKADGDTMDCFARMVFEMDGSRPFHRTSPWGGSIHNYDTYWNLKDMDVTLQLQAPFMGEFGMASAPNLESVRRYLPREEWEQWDRKAKDSFHYHMPRFNELESDVHTVDMDHLDRCVPHFNAGTDMASWIVATQLAQATCIRHTLESFRSRWPESTGICYYKLTDVYPACSWSTLDYYGVPKLSYYVLQDSYAPLHAMIRILSTNAVPEYALFLLDDALETAANGCQVIFRVFDSALRERQFISREVQPTQPVTALGTLELPPELHEETPLLLTAEVCVDGRTVDRTFYWQNHRRRTGCLFDLPATQLRCRIPDAGHLEIVNAGTLPAVGVTVACPEHDTHFVTEDSVFWLEAGESRTLQVNMTEGLHVQAWNAPEAAWQ